MRTKIERRAWGAVGGLAAGIFAACVLGIACQAAAPDEVSSSNSHDRDYGPVSYDRQIKPILANNCYACHGPDENRREADLRLDVRESAVDYAIVPGKSDESVLVERISAEDPDERMPPPDSKKPALTSDQIALIRRWIDAGAKFQKHWAYVPPRRPDVPRPADATWAVVPIDCFILARQKEHGLEPSPEADRRTLIRRLSFDLVGLPPEPAEVDAFVADRSPGAYERLVDRLLSSPHYGERMALYWLDVARYADTGGYHSDNHRDVWLWRDWVIDAFNRNEPFDQFTVEQLAGDLLPEPTRDQRIASGYNRLLQTTEEGGAQPKEYTAIYAADRVRNTATAWLGATLGCAQCHDHKFDPYKQRDFYSFAAFFADVKEKAVGRQDQTPMPTAEQTARMAELDRRIAGLFDEDEERDDLIERKKDLARQAPTTLITESVEPRTVRILPRGNWQDDSGEVVSPAVPAFLGRLDVEGRRATRLDLARWIVSPEQPQTARVFVNRLWQLFFGQGLVKTADDFGSQGEPPTHPELLDWLAVEFRQSGWDVKHMVRLMVTSRTYRQSSSADEAHRRLDPGNRWLARQGRFRLDAELVRDNALSIAGLLSPRIGGPSVKPYQPAGYWANLNFPKREYHHDHGENQYRRGLYTYWQRTFLHPSLMAFDAPSREECTVTRPRSNTPLQALVLLNDPTYVEAARVFAAHIVAEGGPTGPERIRFAVRRALGRAPTDEEVRLLASLCRKHEAEYAADPAAATALVAEGEWPEPNDVAPAELAAWTSVARTLLNLNETITRE